MWSRWRSESVSGRLAFASALLALGLFAAGCPGDDTDDNGGDGDPDMGQQMDTGQDAEPDTEPMDTAMDTAQDMGQDVEPDAEPDVEPDVEPDTMPDAPPTGGETPGAGDVVMTEAQPDPGAVSDADGEYLEFYNPSASTTYELQGCSLTDASDNGGSFSSSLEIGPQQWVVIAKSTSPGFTPDGTFPGTNLSLNNGGDTITLECDGTLVDEINYGNHVPADGYSTQLSPGSLSATANDTASNWCDSPMTAAYNSGGGSTDYGTPGSVNPACAAP